MVFLIFSGPDPKASSSERPFGPVAEAQGLQQKPRRTIFEQKNLSEQAQNGAFRTQKPCFEAKKKAKTMPKQAIWHAETPPVRRPVQQTQRLRPRLMRQHAVVVDHLFGTTRAENASVSHRNASVFIGKRLRKGEMSSHFSYFFHDSS